MRVLKFFLFTILSICLIWGATLMMGPRALLFLLEREMGNKITVTNLTISPRLEIKASRIDLKDINFGAAQPVSGYARAVSLAIKDFFVLKPRVLISVGPANFSGSIEFSSLNLNVEPNLEDLNVLAFEVTAKSINPNESVKVATIGANGKFLRQQLKIEDFVLSINDLGFSQNKIIKIGQIDGFINSISFKNNAFYIPVFNAKVEKITSDENQIHSQPVMVSGSLKDGDYQVFFNANGFQSLDNSLKIGEISLGLTGDDLSFQSWKAVTAELGGLKISEPLVSKEPMSISKVSGIIKNMNDGLISLDTNGAVKKLKIISNGSFIADLPDMEFAVQSVGPIDIEGPLLKLGFDIQTDEEKDLNLSGSISLEMNEPKLVDCITISCELEKINFSYELFVDGEVLSGISACSRGSCSDSSASHSFQTIDTKKLFSNLSKSNLLNPIVLALIYKEFLSGTKVGMGHLLEF